MVVVFVGMIRAELVTEFVKNEAVRVLRDAVGEPASPENACVVMETRLPEQVAGAIASPPATTLPSWPIDELDVEMLSNQSLRDSLGVFVD